MGKHIEYSQEKVLDEALDKALHSTPAFIPLLDNIKIGACFLVRVDDEGTSLAGDNDPVVVKKVPPDIQVFTKAKLHFIMVVDYHFWENATEKQQQAYMHRALARLQVEKSDKGISVKTRKWDVQEMISTVEIHGPYTEPLSLFAEKVKFRKTSLAVAAAGADKITAKEKAKDKKPEPEPEPEPDESPAEEEEKPRVVARPIPPKKPKATAEEDADDEPRRPARRIPPDPAPPTAAEEEPEPED